MSHWTCEFDVPHLISSYSRITKFYSALLTESWVFFFSPNLSILSTRTKSTFYGSKDSFAKQSIFFWFIAFIMKSLIFCYLSNYPMNLKVLFRYKEIIQFLSQRAYEYLKIRLLPFRSPLLRESLLLSFPLATKMFQFTRLSLAYPWIQQQFERLTYLRISGSMLAFNSLKHFVVCYALLHLWVPRYPP